MAQKPPDRTLYHVGCPCGGTFSMDARGFGRPIVCKKCGGSYTIGWGKDSKTGKTMPIAVGVARKHGESTPLQVSCTCGYRRAVSAKEAAGHNRCPGCGKVMIVVKPPAPKGADGERVVSHSSPPPTSGGSEPRLVKIDPGTQTVDCVCGERILVRSETIGQLISCPGCSRKIRVEHKEKSGTYSMPFQSKTPTPPPGLTCECGQVIDFAKVLDSQGTVCPRCRRTIKMEKVRGPQTKHTIIRPRFGPKGGSPASIGPKPGIPAPAAKPSDGFLGMAPVESSQEVAPSKSRRDSGTQAVFCPCGEALTVGTEDVGRNIQCPTCLTLIAVDQIRDGASGNYVLRVRAIGKMDQDTWSLNDFS